MAQLLPGYDICFPTFRCATNRLGFSGFAISSWADMIVLLDTQMVLSEVINLGEIIFGQPPKVTSNDFGPAVLNLIRQRGFFYRSVSMTRACYNYANLR
jgi:hypothetical protein